MNPFARFRDFISYPSHGRTMGLLAFLIIVLAIPLTVNIAQKQQELRQRAANTCDVNDVCTGWNYTSCFVNEGQNCGNQIEGAKCVSGECRLDGSTIDSSGTSFCQASGYHPICSGFSKPFFECLPGSADEQNKKVAQCSQPSPSAETSGCPSGEICVTPATEDLCTAPGKSCKAESGKICSGGVCYVVTTTSGGTSAPSTVGSCGGKNCSSNETCIGHSFDSGTECLTKGTGGLNSYCGTPSGSPSNEACTSKNCGSDLRCKASPGGAPVSPGTSAGGTTCGAPYLGSCKQGDAVQKPLCITPAGWSGKSIQACQDSGSGVFCWYDAYKDPGNVSAGKEKQFCYENKEAALSLTGPGQALPANKLNCANPTCSEGDLTKRSDDSWYCFKGDRWVGSAVCPASAAKPPCDDIATLPACQAAANSCNATKGKRTYTKNRIKATGSTECSGVLMPDEACDLASATTTCTSPNTCNSSNQCVAQSQPPQTGNTQLTFAIGLDGIGNTGDRKSPNNSSGSNKNPRTQAKSFSVEIYNGNTLFKTVGSGLLTSTTAPRFTYNSSTGKYEGTLLVDLPAGTYKVKIGADKYLKKSLGDVTSGIPVAFNSSLVAGAMAGNNFLSVSDYNNLVGCLFKPLQPSITFCNLADLDDNGVVDQFDYNLFIREIAVVQNGD